MLARLGLAVGLLSLAPSASAQDAPGARVSMAWARAAGAEACISEGELTALIERRLGRPVFVAPGAADFHVEARATADAAGGFRVTMRLDGVDGSLGGVREVHGPGADCRAMDDSLSLVLGLLVDLPSPRTVLTLPPPPPPPTPAPVPAPPEPWGLRIDAGCTLTVGLVPRAALGPRVAVSVAPPGRGSVVLAATPWARARARAGGAGADLSVGLIDLFGCLAASTGTRHRADVCVGGAFGALRRQAFGLDVVDDGVDPFGAFGARARVEVRAAGPLVIGAELGLLVPVSRYRYFYTDVAGSQRDLFETSPVLLTATVTAGLTP